MISKHLLKLTALGLVVGSALILTRPAAAQQYYAFWTTGSGNETQNYRADLLFNSAKDTLAVTNESASSFALKGLFLSGTGVDLLNGAALNWNIDTQGGTVQGYETGASNPVEFHYTDALAANSSAYDILAGGSATFNLAGAIDLTANGNSPFAVQYADGSGSGTVIVDKTGPSPGPEPAFYQMSALLGLGGIGLFRRGGSVRTKLRNKGSS